MSWLIMAKVTALFAFGLSAVCVMRRSSSSMRHLLIVVTFICALLLPVLETVAPRWQVIPATTHLPALVEFAPMQQMQSAASFDATTASAKHPAIKSVRSSNWMFTIWQLWFVGALSLGLILLVRIGAMQRVVRRAEPIHDRRWSLLREQLSQELGITIKVHLKMRNTNTMPAVWGVFTPVVLLPADCQSWSPERRRDVLAHEFAHIRRRDVVSILLAHLVCAVYWFHPLAWVLKQKLETECEHACDDLAIATGKSASTYADHLLNTAVVYHQSRSLAPVMAARSQMEGRIMAILDPKRCRNGMTKNVTLLVAVIAITALVPLSSMARAQAGDSARAQMSSASDSAEFRQHLKTLNISKDRTAAYLSGLDSADAMTRAASAWALADTHEPHVIDALVRAGYDSDATVRQWAIRSLSTQKSESTAAMLQASMQDSDAEVREWAARSLGDYESADIRAAIADRFAIESNSDVSEWLIRSIGDANDPGSINALISALNNQHADVRQWAARGLDQAQDDRAVDALINTLSDRNDEVREWSARALAMCGNNRAIVPLRALDQDSNLEVREWARFALDQIEC